MDNKLARRLFWLRAVAILAIAFGIITIKSGGEVVFGVADARSVAGNFVPFVVWFNFLAGFVYVAAGAGLWLRRRWAAILAVALAAGTALAFAAFGMHVAGGGAYEMRTVWALTLRFAVWGAIALFAWRALWTPRAGVLNDRAL
jgi:hypothetical protein